MTPKKFTLLSLGDSYTIGEGVPLIDNFPNQLVRLLNESGYIFAEADILATTGWTVQELLEAIKKTPLTEKYDFVTLLIGVNNQYRGYPIKEYEQVFQIVLKIAIRFAGDNAGNVFVLGIPDWGQTPFAQQRDKQIISKEIAAYNDLNKRIAEKSGANFLADPEMLLPSEVAADGLHPAVSSYSKWAETLSVQIKNNIA